MTLWEHLREWWREASIETSEIPVWLFGAFWLVIGVLLGVVLATPAPADVVCPTESVERWVHERAMHWCTPTTGRAAYVWEISVDGEVAFFEQTSTHDVDLVAPTRMGDVTLRVADAAWPEVWSGSSTTAHVRISWDYDGDCDIDGRDFLAFRREIFQGLPPDRFPLFRSAWLRQDPCR